MAAVEDEDAALYGAAAGEEVTADVGLGGDTAVAEEAALEDEGAGAKGEEGGDNEDEDEDDGVDVIIDQDDLQTPGRPGGGAGMWGGAALVSAPASFGTPRGPALCQCAGLPSRPSAQQLCAPLMHSSAAEPEVRAQGRRSQARRAGRRQGR
jgi:hypothetical protein